MTTNSQQKGLPQACISSSSNDQLSGNFSVKLINTSSDTTEIAGSFATIDLRP
jgi:hypothetical protein